MLLPDPDRRDFVHTDDFAGVLDAQPLFRGPEGAQFGLQAVLISHQDRAHPVTAQCFDRAGHRRRWRIVPAHRVQHNTLARVTHSGSSPTVSCSALDVQVSHVPSVGHYVVATVSDIVAQ